MKKELVGAKEEEGGQPLGDWRGERLARVRTLIQQADPDVVEECALRLRSSGFKRYGRGNCHGAPRANAASIQCLNAVVVAVLYLADGRTR